MRLGVQDRLVPGATLREKYDAARAFGFDALELSERPAFEEARTAARERIPVTAIAGGYRGWLIDPDPEQVAVARADLSALIELAGELGTGVIIVPIWGRTRNLPGIATGRTRDQDEALFLEGLVPLVRRAESAGGRIFIEPLNRYQNDLCVTIADALRFAELLASPAALVVGDVDDHRDLVAAGRLPELDRREHGREPLLGADRGQLLADDLLDLPVNAPAERHEGPHACAHLPDEPTADEQLVARSLRVRGRFAQRRQEKL